MHMEKSEEKMTLDKLAQMMAKGFENTASKEDIIGVNTRVDSIENKADGIETKIDILAKKLDHTDARIARIEADMKEIRGNIVYKHEFEDLTARVKYIESKLGIESGK